MDKTGNDAGTVMKYSGHKTIESFSIYLRPTDKGRILATHAMDNVDGILTAKGDIHDAHNVHNAETEAVKPLQNQQVAM